MKAIYQPEINQILKIRNALKYYCKLNGTQVMLTDSNKLKADDAVTLLEKAMTTLSEIK